MDPVTLAATIVGSFLVPFLKVGAHKFGDALSREVDGSTASQLVETSITLWERIRSLFGGTDEAKALQAFEQFPDDMRPRVERMLRERLESDEQLRSDLTSLVTRPTPDGTSTGAQIMHARYAVVIDNRGAHIGGTSTIIGMNVDAAPAGGNPEPSDSHETPG